MASSASTYLTNYQNAYMPRVSAKKTTSTKTYQNSPASRVTTSTQRPVSQTQVAYPQLSAPTPTPSAPVATTPPPSLDLDAIRSALSAITGQYALQRGQLRQDRNATKRAFQLMKERFADERRGALESVESDAAGRGLLRSGLYLQEVGDVSEAFTREQAAARSDYDARAAAIASTLEQLRAQEELDRAERARQLAKEQVGTQEAIAKALKLV